MSYSEALAGFVAGSINDCVLYHPDNLKYLSQNNIKPQPVTWGTIPYHTRGIVPICLGGGASYATYFYAYGLCKTKIEPIISRLIVPTGPDGQPNHTPATKTLIAGLGGGLAIIPSTIVSFPFDQVKKHTSVLPELSAGQVARKIYSEGGIKGFFFGWNYTLSRDIYMSALKLGIFEGMSKFMIDHRHDPWYPNWIRTDDSDITVDTTAQSHLNQHSFDGSILQHDAPRKVSQTSTLEASLLGTTEVTTVGLVSGTLTGLISTPVDCVVSRIRSPLTPAHARRGFMACAKWMIEQEPHDKIKPFFRGVVLRTSNYAIGSMVFWSLFSKVQKYTAPWFAPPEGAQMSHSPHTE